MRAADVGAGRRPMAGERSVDISDSIIGLYTLALMFILFIFQFTNKRTKNPCLFPSCELQNINQNSFLFFSIFCCAHNPTKQAGGEGFFFFLAVHLTATFVVFIFMFEVRFAQSKSLFFAKKSTFHTVKVTKSDAHNLRATFRNSFPNFQTIFEGFFVENNFPNVTSQTALTHWKLFFRGQKAQLFRKFKPLFHRKSARSLEKNSRFSVSQPNSVAQDLLFLLANAQLFKLFKPNELRRRKHFRLN